MHVLFRPRWIALHLIMLIAMPLFLVAGFWQLRRLDERRDRNALIVERRDMTPVSSPDGDTAFRRARLSGTYDTAEEVVLTGRPSRGRSGDHLLTPLRLDAGGVVLVDRGWVPIDTPPGAAAPPAGEVTVEGILYPSEGAAPLTGSQGQSPAITRIDLERLDAQTTGDLGDVWLLLREQDPAQRRELPVPGEPVPLSEGSHLSYAVQWFLFTPTAIVVYLAVLRRAMRSN